MRVSFPQQQQGCCALTPSIWMLDYSPFLVLQIPLLWFNSASYQAPHSCSLTPPRPEGWGGELEKNVKLQGWDKNNLIGKAKAMHASKAKQGIHSPTSHGQAGVQPSPGSRAPSRVMVTWEDKHHNAKCPPPSFFFPQFIYSAWCPMVWNTSLASLGQLSWLCPLPVSCALQPLAGRAQETKKSLI